MLVYIVSPLKSFLQLVLIFLCCICLIIFAPSDESSKDDQRASAVRSSKIKIKVVINKAKEAFSSFTILPVSGSGKIYLIDQEGEVKHRWNIDAARARLLGNCNILVVHGSKYGKKIQKWKDLINIVRAYDWDGNVVWEYKSDNNVHHDIQRLDNGNTLILEKVNVPYKIIKSLKGIRNKVKEIKTDRIVEVNPQGEVVWSWNAYDYLDLHSNGSREKVTKKLNNLLLSDWTHINTIQVIKENQWSKSNSAFKPGNIIIIPRNWWNIMIIDKESGKVVWTYDGDGAHGPLIRGHDAHMIDNDLYGAGNILVFDNGLRNHRSYSIIREINPLTKKTVWSYSKKKFFSRGGGSIQRLPNGNTFISEDIGGKAFEIKPNKEIVWEVNVPGRRVSRASKVPLGYCPQLS